MGTARPVKEVGRQVPDENGGYDGLEHRWDAVVGDRDGIGPLVAHRRFRPMPKDRRTCGCRHLIEKSGEGYPHG